MVYLLLLLKPTPQAHEGKTKLFINCFRNPTITCATENWRNHNSGKQPTVDCTLEPIKRSGIKHHVGKVTSGPCREGYLRIFLHGFTSGWGKTPHRWKMNYLMHYLMNYLMQDELFLMNDELFDELFDAAVQQNKYNKLQKISSKK